MNSESLDFAEYDMMISERIEVAINREETAPEGLQEPGSPGRDQRGRWIRGCAPGPGRPPAAREEAYREALQAAASPEDLGMVFGKVMERARAGDIAAARLVMQQLVGPPGSAMSQSVSDDPDPWERLRTIGPLITALAREVPLPRLAELIRAHMGSSLEPGSNNPERSALLAMVFGVVPELERRGFMLALKAPSR